MNCLFIAGASSDIGTALIHQIADKYETIWAHYYHWNNGLEQIKQKYGSKIIFIKANLTNQTEIEHILNDVSNSERKPDSFVYLPMSKIKAERFLKTKLEDYIAGLELSIDASVSLLKGLLPYMQKTKKGRIVFMLSSVTQNKPPKYESPYVVSKFALLGLMKSLAAEYEGKGITVNAVSPDMMQTKFITELPHIMVENYKETKPGQELIKVNEVVPVIVFLLSDEASHITGNNICI